MPKIDEALASALHGTAPVTALLALAPTSASAPAPLAESVRPDQFSTRGEWRAEMNRRSHDRSEAAYGPTIELLRGLGLDVRGGALGTVVAHGTPDQLRRALQLDEVIEATLDRPIDLKTGTRR